MIFNINSWYRLAIHYTVLVNKKVVYGKQKS